MAEARDNDAWKPQFLAFIFVTVETKKRLYFDIMPELNYLLPHNEVEHENRL